MIALKPTKPEGRSHAGAIGRDVGPLSHMRLPTSTKLPDCSVIPGVWTELEHGLRDVLLHCWKDGHRCQDVSPVGFYKQAWKIVVSMAQAPMAPLPPCRCYRQAAQTLRIPQAFASLRNVSLGQGRVLWLSCGRQA